MLYDSGNSRGSKAYDKDAGCEITRVLSVDTDAMHVRVGFDPIRRDEFGGIASQVLRFARIDVEETGRPGRKVFHCYGRIQ